MTTFPLRGVIGIVANGLDEIQQAAAKRLQCVEIRGDLLLDAGLSEEGLIGAIREARQQGLACLFTLRHPSHGGKFTGSEDQRAVLSRRALAAGADIIDLEWGSVAARAMLGEGVPMILSHHDFSNMPGAAALAELTEAMENGQPAAIKVVPTAASLGDAARMLNWVAQASEGIRRIGFAMGEIGACSRILTTVFGAPITYASFGAPVAPGQVAIDDLLDTYRVATLTRETRVEALIIDDAAAAVPLMELNQRLRAEGQERVGLSFPPQYHAELLTHSDALRVDSIHVDQTAAD